MTLARSFLENKTKQNKNLFVKTKSKGIKKKKRTKQHQKPKQTEELLYPQSNFRNKRDTKEQKLTQKPWGSNIRP